MYQHSHYRYTFFSQKEKKGPEKILEEIVAENFPNMGKEIVSQVQESQRVPSRINPKGNTLRHIVIKLTKIKDRVIRSNKGQMTSNIQRNSHQAIS